MEITAAGVFETAFLGVLGIAAWQDKKSLSISRKFLFVAGVVAIFGRHLLADEHNTVAEWGLSILPGVFLLLSGWLSGWQIGAGDGVIVLVMGLWLGFAKTLVVLLTGMLFCSIFCGVLVFFKRAERRTEIPFVPFLLAACLIGRIMG